MEHPLRSAWRSIVIAVICCSLLVAQAPQIAVEKPVQKKPSELIEIKATDGEIVDWTVIEPPDLDYRVVESGRVFLAPSFSRTGFVRVIEITFTPSADGKSYNRAKRLHSYQVGQAVPVQPATPPSAKVTATPQRVDAKKIEPVHVEWTTAPEGVTVQLNSGDGSKDVDPNGSAVILPQRTTLVTVAATDPSGVVAYSQVLIVVSEEPAPPVIDAKALVSIVYESSATPVPRQVHNARFELEAKGYEVRVVDADVVTGTGTVPLPLKPAIEAARAQGLPALVITNGEKVLKKIALPATAEEIVKAVSQ